MSRRLNEIKTSLNFQIQNAITTAIAETVLPSIQNTLDMQGRDNFTMVDRGSKGLHVGTRTTNFTKQDQRFSGLQRNPEAENAQKTWENRLNASFAQEKCRYMSRQS